MKRKKNKAIETAIKQAVEHATPDVLDRILSDCANQKGEAIVMTRTVKKFPIRAVIGIAAAFAVIITASVVGLGLYNRAGNEVTATVSIDVNPSIELKVNHEERVLSVTAQNTDAQNVIGTMDLQGSSLDVAVNALIGSMLKKGYISDTANSVLITVDGQNAQKLQKTLSYQVSEQLKSDNFTGAILSQELSKSDELKSLAERYGVSMGKARLIQLLLATHPTLASTSGFEELVALSINELNLLLGETKDASINASGMPSDKSYIGEEAAKKAALTHAGLSDANFQKCKLDYEDGAMVYEIVFFVKTEQPFGNGILYEYEIHAVTGAIVEYESEPITLRGDQPSTDVPTVTKPSGTSPTQSSSHAVISVQEAKAIALHLVDLQESEIFDFECELDRENGVTHYEIEFSSGNVEYEIDINAHTGAILKQSKDLTD